MNAEPAADALAALRACSSQEPGLNKTLSAVWEMVEPSEIVADLECELIVANMAQAPPLVHNSRYATTNCKAIVPERLIVADERFLLEVEAAVRSFELAGPLATCPYVQSDEALFGLTDRISANPTKQVKRMRLASADSREKEQAVQDIVALTYLFFIGHEMGHLLNGNDTHSFAEFVQPDAPLEYRLTNAVVKLRRHAEEFASFGFDLPGFEAAITPGSEVEQTSAELRRQIADLNMNHTAWFNGETQADATGTRILTECLAAIDDPGTRRRCMYRMARGMFATAMYAWYKDLRGFCQALSIEGLSNAQQLVLAMAEDRKHYIHAASLFGDVHRFTLLRAERVLEALIRDRTTLFDKTAIASHWRDNQGRDAESDTMLYEVAARYYLLASMMDTAVKLAYFGAGTAWVIEADRRRGTQQMFLMSFESVAAAMRRVRRMLHASKEVACGVLQEETEA